MCSNCFEVDPDGIKKLTPTPDANGVYAIGTDEKNAIEKGSFLAIGGYKARGKVKFGTATGVKDLQQSQFDLSVSQGDVNKKQDYLGTSLGTTLYGLNNYLSNLKTAIIQYSVSPTTSNLSVLLDALKEAEKFNVKH